MVACGTTRLAGPVGVVDEELVGAGRDEGGSNDARSVERQPRGAGRGLGPRWRLRRRGHGHDVSHWKALLAGMVPMRRIRPPQSGQSAKESRRASVLGSPSAGGATSSSLGSWRFRRSSKSRT